MSGLPKGWVEATISDVGSTTDQAVLTGPFGASLGKADFKTSGVPVFTIGCLGNGYIIEEKLSFISDQKAEELAAYRLREGDLMFSRMATVGRVGFVPPRFAGSIFNYHLMRLRLCHAVIETRFFYHYAKGSELVASYLADQNRGATRDGINTKLLEQLPISLPPLAEQKRIVAKLEALSAKSARARTELARIETLVSRYKQAVLSKAFSGELTPQHRGACAIEFDKRAAAQIDGRTLDLPVLPATWSWVALRSVAEVSGGLTKNSKRDSLLLQLPYLRVANVYANELRLDDISIIGCTENEVARTTLRAGDLLLVEGNGSLDQIGRVALWGGELDRCVHQNHLIKVRPGKGLESKFALYWLLSPLGRRAIEAVAASSAGLHTLSLSKVGGLPLPLCNSEEQHEIVRRIEAAFARIDRLAGEATRALALVGRLDEAILAKAFRGELVPQDETDEPAERLLARIRAERQAAPKARRGRSAKA